MPTIGQPGQEARPEASLGRRWQFLDATLQALATTAGLVTWIVLVGGIEAYLRLRAANVPDPTRAVTLLPRNVLIAQGLHLLAAPLVLAVGLAALGLLTATMLARTRWAVYVAPGSLAVLAAGAAAFAVADQVRQYDWLAWVAGILLFTLGLAFLGLGATSRWPTPATLAMTLAAAVAVWSGTFELVTARIGDPRFRDRAAGPGRRLRHQRLVAGPIWRRGDSHLRRRWVAQFVVGARLEDPADQLPGG
jgi:hypothetical protein